MDCYVSCRYSPENPDLLTTLGLLYMQVTQLFTSSLLDNIEAWIYTAISYS